MNESWKLAFMKKITNVQFWIFPLLFISLVSFQYAVSDHWFTTFIVIEMYFRCWVTWLLPFQNAYEFPSYSTSIFVVHEQDIIYWVFNDELLLSSGWNTSLSQTACQVLSLSSSLAQLGAGQLWPAEKRHWDQKGKIGSGRCTKGTLMSPDTSWCDVLQFPPLCLARLHCLC